MRNSSLEVLEGRIGYHFKDRYLLECALTHTSFANEQKIHRYKDYERLEFLGDAVLEMVSSAFLYNEYPESRLWRTARGTSGFRNSCVWERAKRSAEAGTKSLSCAT